MNKLKHRQITEKIIGAAFEVHKTLGCGVPEVIYQRALAYELSKVKLDYDREISQNIYYKNAINPIGNRRADFIVESKVLLELKAISELNDTHLNQILNYLKAYKFEVGLLLNFGSQSLQIKRVVNY